MSYEELILIQKILPDLYLHFKAFPNSFLARIYGVYRVHMKNYQPVYLMMMGNTLKFKNKDFIRRIYDLKGSRVARNVDTRVYKNTMTLKDINFLNN